MYHPAPGGLASILGLPLWVTPYLGILLCLSCGLRDSWACGSWSCSSTCSGQVLGVHFPQHLLGLWRACQIPYAQLSPRPPCHPQQGDSTRALMYTCVLSHTHVEPHPAQSHLPAQAA